MQSDWIIDIPYAKLKNETIKSVKENYIAFYEDFLIRKTWVIVESEEEDGSLVEEQYLDDAMIDKSSVSYIRLHDISEDDLVVFRVSICVNNGFEFQIHFNSYKAANQIKKHLYFWWKGIK